MKTITSKLSQKQIEIILVLIKGNGNDETNTLIPCDLNQLIERLSYSPSKPSIQFSIRALIRRGLIFKLEKLNRRGRKRVLFAVTDLARQIVTSDVKNPLVETQEDIEIEQLLTTSVLGETERF